MQHSEETEDDSTDDPSARATEPSDALEEKQHGSRKNNRTAADVLRAHQPHTALANGQNRAEQVAARLGIAATNSDEADAET